MTVTPFPGIPTLTPPADLSQFPVYAASAIPLAGVLIAVAIVGMIVIAAYRILKEII